MSKRSEYIYLVETSESVNHYEHIYKIGKTTQAPHKRMNGYQKGSKLYLTLIFNDCTTAENELMKIFKERFEHIKNWGKEYFRGDVVEMMRVIIEYHALTYTYDDNVGVDAEYIKVDNVISQNQSDLNQVTLDCPVIHSANELSDEVKIINNQSVVNDVNINSKVNDVNINSKVNELNSSKINDVNINSKVNDTKSSAKVLSDIVHHEFDEYVTKNNGIKSSIIAKSYIRDLIRKLHPELNAVEVNKELTVIINEYMMKKDTKPIIPTELPKPVLHMDQLPCDNKHNKPVPLLTYEETIAESIEDKSSKVAIYVNYDVNSGVFDVETIDVYSSSEEFKNRIDPKDLKFDLDRDSRKLILNETQSTKFMETYVEGRSRYIIIMKSLIKQKYKFRPFFSTIYRLHNVDNK